MKIYRVIVTSLTIMIGFLKAYPQDSSFRIDGQLSSEKQDKISLYKIIRGGLQEIASTDVNKKSGAFGFSIYPETSGIYMIGTGDSQDVKGKFAIWIQPAEQLHVELTDSTYQVVNNQMAPTNKLLFEWQQITQDIRYKSFFPLKTLLFSTYEDFFPDLQKVEMERNIWLSKVKNNAPSYYEEIKNYTFQDLIFIANFFLLSPRSKHPTEGEKPLLYKNLKAAEVFSNVADVYDYPWGLRSLGLQLQLETYQSGMPVSGNEWLKRALLNLKNDTLKGDFLMSYIGRYKDNFSYMEAKDLFGQYIMTDEQKATDLELQSKFVAFKVGERGLNFTYPDTENKNVSFSDFKGKVVLVDVWATWCGPCLAELPALKKLEEEFEGTDVQVVSISVDEDKDKEKWKKMIAEKQMGGIQLFASGWSDITKYYKINGIPRFMVFDKEGKIVTVDAPRPSDPKLAALLKDVLDK